MGAEHTMAGWRNLPSAVVFVEVKKPSGDLDIGTGFHIGNGYFATARHVVEGNRITKIGRRDMSKQVHVGRDGTTFVTTYPEFEHSQIERVLHHPKADVDVSVIQLSGRIGMGRGFQASQLQPSMTLNKYADVLTEGELFMTQVIVSGYPRIPSAMETPLVSFRGDISSVYTGHLDKKRHLIISGMARGGFSGSPVFVVGPPEYRPSVGPAADSPGTIIGIVSQAVVSPGSTVSHITELGFIDALSVETIREVVQHYDVYL